ncbi:MAG: DUF3990 domain-containing protein [Peptococcaceae bacterium]|jgi:hypothetical protein|nr:DUF3990 domain-containing protein [Peptococcaceae bacterium]
MNAKTIGYMESASEGMRMDHLFDIHREEEARVCFVVGEGNGQLELYHGSKSGIEGAIRPISRSLCDFGAGFYMGTEELQALTLICNFPKAILYKVSVDLTGLRLLDMEIGLDWALLIAFYRGKMETLKDNSLYRKYAAMLEGCDMVSGYIANDRMFMVLDRFFSGEITDAALLHSLSALKLGKQYVALTERACGRIRILEAKAVGEKERNALRVQSETYRQEGIRQAEEICRRYRRDGRFFDEITGGGA